MFWALEYATPLTFPYLHAVDRLSLRDFIPYNQLLSSYLILIPGACFTYKRLTVMQLYYFILSQQVHQHQIVPNAQYMYAFQLLSLNNDSLCYWLKQKYEYDNQYLLIIDKCAIEKLYDSRRYRGISQ